jgi:hypothetical protein
LNGSQPRNQRGDNQSLLDSITLLYLAVPTLLFSTWLKPIFAIPVALLYCYGAWQTLGKRKWACGKTSKLELATLFIVAMAWTSLSGIGHWFYANSDWIFRDALLRDLTLTAWPPEYSSTSASPLILRAPVGYYLPAALIGSIGGLKTAEIALYLWTSLGFFLVLSGAISLFEKRTQRVLAVLLMLGFGGLDFLGYALIHASLPRLGQHIEWWAVFAQYSSNSTLFFWVPNYAIPAWLCTLIILRHWRSPQLAKLTPLLGSSILIWSPFAALGTAPFFLAGINWKNDIRTVLSPKITLPIALLTLVCLRYLTMGSTHIPGGWIFPDNGKNIRPLTTLYLAFCLLEFGLLAMILWRLKAFDIRIKISIIILALLPLYKFGYGNDIVMRASIPALMILALSTVIPLCRPGPRNWKLALAGILSIGLLGSIQEPVRALTSPRWRQGDMTLVEAWTRYLGISEPSTYVTHFEQGDMKMILRRPSTVPLAKGELLPVGPAPRPE